MESVIEELAAAAPAVDAAYGPTGTMVDVIKVDHRAGGRRVLHEVSLSIAPGELVALAGGSGAGKTTLLEIMAGLRRPVDGTVLHDGVPTGATKQAPAVGYVPQDDIIHRELPLGR
ncbi:MAG TPA: ATP-binding cassette domain-containing protein, partial [Acidimicrobiales bacterium]